MNIFRFIFLSALAAFATERIEVKRNEGKPLVAYLDRLGEQNGSIVFLIQGAQQESVKRMHDCLKEQFLKSGLGVASLEKEGIEGPGASLIDEKLYNQCNTLQNRIEDHRLLLNYLKRKGWKGSVAFVGQGEGGKVAAALAADEERLLALILIAAGGGWSPIDELLSSFRSEMAAQGFGPQYIQSFLVQSRDQFDRAMKKPTADLKLFGFSYKYWESLTKRKLLDDLSHVQGPIYYIHADLDDRIPVESADMLVKAFKAKPGFSSKRYAKGREIIQDPETYQDAVTWMKQHGCGYVNN